MCSNCDQPATEIGTIAIQLVKGAEVTSLQTTQADYYHSKLAYEMDAADLFDALVAGQQLVVVDGRSQTAYEEEHIPSSKNLPHREIGPELIEGLDKGHTYVCYCGGIGCNASTKTALKLLTLGFEVRELIGGLDWWKRDGYATTGTSGRSGKEMKCGY